MADIKPIETVYNGYRFRSRLEARWAVFFDAAGIDYEYEPEGYTTYVGGYLPDFYLPRFDIYAEVKGSDDQLRTDSIKIGYAIDYRSTPMSEKGLIILGKIPYRDAFNDSLGNRIPAFPMLSWRKGIACGYCSFAYFFRQRTPHVFLCTPTQFRAGDDELLFFKDLPEICWPSAESAMPREISIDCYWTDFDGLIVDVARTMHPYLIARQARFEHGETPKVTCEYRDTLPF